MLLREPRHGLTTLYAASKLQHAPSLLPRLTLHVMVSLASLLLRAASLLLYLAAPGLSTYVRSLFATVPGCVWPLYSYARPLCYCTWLRLASLLLRADSLLLYLPVSGLSTVACGLFATIPGCVWPLYCCARPLFNCTWLRLTSLLLCAASLLLYLAASGLSTASSLLYLAAFGLSTVARGLFAMVLYLAASGLSTVARGLFSTVPGCV